MNKRDDILQAAEKLFYTHGFHPTSTDQICAAARVSTRTFYRYFPSREMLTKCVMEERQTRFFGDLHPSDHPQAVNKLFAVLEKWMSEQGALGCFFAKAWGEYAEQDALLAARALDFRYAIRDYIAACIAQRFKTSDDSLANAIWMLFEGAVTAAVIQGSATAFQAEQAAALLMNIQEKQL
ncbi:TetR/AcrR family transcriptional regulator [Rouxiella sp. T17]|uniref:TetR/AcrR family transcriptional regulator n=1 Tax=Rouxiella sp. T17 TaxID=3085684 RepID=UPI002FC9FE94